MKNLLSIAVAAAISFGVLPSAHASLVDNTGYSTMMSWNVFDHPDGNKAPPTYSLRLNNLKGQGKAWTFSSGDFHPTNTSSLMLDVLKNNNNPSDLRVRIYGSVFGGRDYNNGYAASSTGNWDIDFTYVDNVSMAGDLVKVGPASANNKGLFTPSFGDPKTHGIQSVKLVDKHNNLFESLIHNTDQHRLTCPGDGAACNHWTGRGWLTHWSTVEKQYTFRGKTYTRTKIYDGHGDFLYTAAKKQPPVSGDTTPLGLLFGAGLAFLGLTHRRKTFKFAQS